MIKARNQAEQYARSLPTGEPATALPAGGRRGLLHRLFAEFTQTGRLYVAFPDPRANRIMLADLLDGEKRKLLHQVWTTPPRHWTHRAAAPA